MSALSVNLKQFYQRRGMWLMYAFWAMNGYFIFHLVNLSQKFARSLDTINSYDATFLYLWPMILCIMSGAYIASMLGEGLIRPIVFMLPRYPKVLRNVLLRSGIFISAVWCVVFTLLFGKMDLKSETNLLGSFGLNMLGFTLGTVFAFAGVWKIHLFWIIVPILFWQGPELVTILQTGFNGYPWVLIGLSATLCTLGWSYLGKEGLVRKFQDQQWLRLFGVIPFSKRKYAETTKPGPALTGVERFFFKRIQSCKSIGIMKNIWGYLYNSLAPMSVNGTCFILPLFLAIPLIPLGYLNSPGNDIVLRLYSMTSFIMSVSLSLPIFYSLLFVGGRSERFVTSVIVTFISGLSTIIFMCSVSLESYFLNLILPSFSIKGYELLFIPLSLQYVWLPILIIPSIMSLRVLWRLSPVCSVLLASFQYILTVTMVPLLQFGFFKSGFLVAAGFVILAWIIFIFVCWLASKRASLVKAR